MSWGRHWGRFWGHFSPGAPFGIELAWASAPNAFRVAFTKQPHLITPLHPGDVSKLSNWTLTRQDASQTLTILTVSPVQDEPLLAEFTIVQRWAASLAEYRIVGNAALRAADGIEPIATPAQADFFGSPNAAPNIERALPLVDIYSPQTSPTTISGGIEVGSNGDYRLESGMSLLKKIITRDVLYEQDEFMHLAGQDFGFGAREKELIKPVDLVTRKRKLEDRIARNPEVRSVTVRIDQYADGRQVIQVRARTDFGVLDEEFAAGGPGG